MRLSFSQVNTYLTCPKKWHIEKVERISPIQRGSPLSIGSAIDGAAEYYLLHLKNEDAKSKSLEEFEKLMRAEHIEHDIKYSVADVQLELFDAAGFLTDAGFDTDPKEFMTYCKQNKSDLDDAEIAALKVLQIEGVVAKGLLMLPEFFKWADENVKEVHSCQRKIEIQNDLGDSFIGYLDFEVTLNDGERYIFDLKTSGNPGKYFPDDAASESLQLGIYSQETNTPKVGYIVLDKVVRKREPRVRSREVRGEITDEFLDEAFEHIESVRQDIAAKKFDKNYDGCYKFGQCPYFNYCKHNSMVGLKKEK